MVNVCAAKSSSRSLAVSQSSTNAIARSVESRAALLQMQQRLWPPRIFAGFVALRLLVLGLKTRGFVLIFVQNAALRCPILSEIHPMFGCLPVCSTQTHNWKSVLICLLRPKHLGTQLPRPERNTKPCPSYLSLLRFFTQKHMPNTSFNRTAKMPPFFLQSPCVAAG
jgi:hypothetical protein